MPDSPDDMLIDITEDDPNYEVSAQDEMQSLKEIADRVSRQVEEFAQRMHKFDTESAADEQGSWDNSSELFDDLGKITGKRSKRLHDRRSQSNSRQVDPSDEDREIERVGLERHLWILLSNLVVCASPKAKADAETAQSGGLEKLHRYSGVTDIWNTFLDCDCVAQEHETILSWLQERARELPGPKDGAIESKIADSGRVDGVWSSGPLFTKTLIKQQKRSHTHDRPLDPTTQSLPRLTGGQRMVTQLDPDSHFRQEAQLESQDRAYEEAAWMTCWQMLRRGASLEEIRSWAAERSEWWRACLLQGCDVHASETVDSPFRHIINLVNNPGWLAQCRSIAHSSSIEDPMLQGIYGLLCGDLQAASKACEDIEDDSYALFTSTLIQRYLHFIAAYKKRVAAPETSRYQSAISDHNEVLTHMQQLQNAPSNQGELQKPFKYVELAILSQNFESFFLEIGHAVSELAVSDHELSCLVQKAEYTSATAPALVTATDEDCVRFVAHLQLVLRSLGYLDQAYARQHYEMENNIVSYIAWLQRTREFSAIALYGSRLSKERTQTVLGAVYMDITDPEERQRQIRLMTKYGIDVPDVLYGIAALENFNNIEKFADPNLLFSAPSFIYRQPGVASQCKIRNGFADGELSDENDRAISSVEWYHYIDAPNWGKACWHISLLYKLWLYEGNFIALWHLRERASLAAISQNGMNMNLRFAVHDSEGDKDDNGDVEMDTDEDGPEPMQSPTRKRKEQKLLHPLARSRTSREALYDQSVVWLHFEQLVELLECFDEWQLVADETEA